MGSDNTMCTKDMACLKTMAALATGRPYIKFHGTTKEMVSINNQAVTFLADPDAMLTRTGGGLLLEIRGASSVAIYDLEITGASGGNAGITLQAGNTATLELHRAKVTGNDGGGISASGGALKISQTTISGNMGGGISLSGSQFDITNCFIVNNGSNGSTVGGIKVDNIVVSALGTHRIDFNTITANMGPMGLNLGIACGTVLTPLTFSDNIIYANSVSGTGSQIGGMNCSATYSDIGPGAFTGQGNISMDPMFISTSQANFHLMPASPAKDAADPNATITFDFDSDMRPQGPRSDIGADEVAH
jgi:hypothetical protein